MLSGWLIAAAAALVLGAVPADRLLAAVARRRLAIMIQAACRAAGRPVISFAESAFVPRLLAGRFREIEVTIGACVPGGLDVMGITARLTDVRVPPGRLIAAASSAVIRAPAAGAARAPRPSLVVAGGLEATAVIGLSALSARLPSGLRLLQHGRDLRVTGTYLMVPVRGTLAVAAGRDRITVTPKLTGVTAPVGFVISLPGLPRRVTVTAVTVTAAGLEVRLGGAGVELPEVTGGHGEP